MLIEHRKTKDRQADNPTGGTAICRTTNNNANSALSICKINIVIKSNFKPIPYSHEWDNCNSFVKKIYLLPCFRQCLMGLCSICGDVTVLNCPILAYHNSVGEAASGFCKWKKNIVVVIWITHLWFFFFNYAIQSQWYPRQWYTFLLANDVLPHAMSCPTYCLVWLMIPILFIPVIMQEKGLDYFLNW